MPIRTRFIYTGRVQGVGFRYTARTTASNYPITGWVRNNPDGSVTLEAQGTPESVHAYRDDLAQKMRSNILHCEEESICTVTDESGFHIRR